MKLRRLYTKSNSRYKNNKLLSVEGHLLRYLTAVTYTILDTKDGLTILIGILFCIELLVYYEE